MVGGSDDIGSSRSSLVLELAADGLNCPRQASVGLLPRWQLLDVGVRTCNSEMLLDALYPPDQILEQLSIGCDPRLRSNGFKITSKVLRRDLRCARSNLGQIAGTSCRLADDIKERPVVDLRILVLWNWVR
jgi:hypothetical protein